MSRTKLSAKKHTTGSSPNAAAARTAKRTQSQRPGGMARRRTFPKLDCDADKRADSHRRIRINAAQRDLIHYPLVRSAPQYLVRKQLKGVRAAAVLRPT